MANSIHTDRTFSSLTYALTMLCDAIIPSGICVYLWRDASARHMAIMSTCPERRQLTRFEIEEHQLDDGETITAIKVIDYNSRITQIALTVVDPLARGCGIRLSVIIEDMTE